jgi:hypothetical protein
MLAAITCHFNPQCYARPVQNYWRFREALRDVKLHTIELSFNGNFELPGAIRVSGGPENVMWQKERLLNLVAETLPAEVDSIVWIDADILFMSHDWVERVQKALESTPVVQPFESAHFLDQHGRVIRSRKSFATVIKGTDNSVFSAPGFAWAARRELFPLLDTAICGGGDKLMAEGWRGNYTLTASRMNKLWCQWWIENSKRQRDLVSGQIGYIPGDIVHLWHGRMDKRNYTDRWKYLTDHRYDPTADIALDKNGLWMWNSDKPQMHAAVAGYFAERCEDG